MIEVSKSGIWRSATALRSLPNTLRFVMSHPLNRQKQWEALRRFLSWQVGARLVPGPVAVDFVTPARLLVSRGMAGATGAVYVGLHEFEDMAFLLHCLRKEELFVDVGANIGSYTVLASAVVGARSLTFEPIPATFSRLNENIALNRIGDRVEARMMAVGNAIATLQITTSFDSMNHIVRPDDASDTPILEVTCTTLDDCLNDENLPALLKVDVEGFEMSVLRGAERSLASGRVYAAIVEQLTEPDHSAVDNVHQLMCKHGFAAVAYDPFRRTLERLHGTNPRGGNTIYVRDIAATEARVRGASPFLVHGVSV